MYGSYLTELDSGPLFSQWMPSDLLVLGDGSGILVADSATGLVRLIDTATQEVTSLASASEGNPLVRPAAMVVTRP
jgi:hypothetical protein